jgi:hypothetical protein
VGTKAGDAVWAVGPYRLAVWRTLSVLPYQTREMRQSGENGYGYRREGEDVGVEPRPGDPADLALLQADSIDQWRVQTDSSWRTDASASSDAGPARATSPASSTT